MTQPQPEDALFDAVARMIGDIDAADSETLGRIAALAAASLRAEPGDEERGLLAELTELDVPDELREVARRAELTGDDLESPPVRVARRDPDEDLLRGRFAGPLTALGESEDIGPIRIGGRRIWFEIYRPAQRFEIIETGAGAPAMVMTSARRPVFRRRPTLDLQPGTLWIRGDLLHASLPAGAYVGIKVTDGKLSLPNVVSAGTDTIEVAAPFEGTLQLQLDVDSVAAAADGCDAGASVTVPDLELTFGTGGLTVESDEGAATAWGTSFTFGDPDGSFEFVASSWTLLLRYEASPSTFDAAAIQSQLAEFAGEATVAGAGLALPVVVANPSILTEAKLGPAWWVELSGIEARWYQPDERYHVLDAWLAIGPGGTSLLAESVPPLDEPVAHTLRLWELADDSGRRVPWRQTYDDAFLFRHVCDAADGESLAVTCSPRVVLDRPVQVDGTPVATPSGLGIMQLHADPAGTQVMLGALVDAGAPENLLALRNALVWATRAVVVLARGVLTGPDLVDEGGAFAYFGVLAWTPTLPDPYVGNFAVRRPDVARPRALLVANVGWSSPSDVTTSFVGRLGPPVVGERIPPPSKQPKPPTEDIDPTVGLTQVAQGTRRYDDEEEARRAGARAAEARTRSKRVDRAEQLDAGSRGLVEEYLEEVLGPTPPVLLLDVSTNQDLLGVAMWGTGRRGDTGPVVTTVPPVTGLPGAQLAFPVNRVEVWAPVEWLRVVTLPQVQWEPVRTLDEDQDILTLGWFPTPLASATDGGPTVLGARSQRLVPAIPEETLDGTREAYAEGTPVAFRTTLPFGLITVVQLDAAGSVTRPADVYEVVRPTFPSAGARGGIQVSALAEGGRPDDGGISPTFQGRMHQLLNGVDLGTGAPLGISVLGSTADPTGSVETVFNNDMAARPRVPVTRFDLSGYGGSNFSEWNNPFAAFAEAAKVQFQLTTGRTALEVIKVTSVLHPWGIRVTRAITIERRSGGGVIRRDSGWQATTPGLFDYRYSDAANNILVAPYEFDAGVFRGLFNVRSIRPAPGLDFSHGSATLVPYYFNAEVALDGVAGRARAIGVLGWLQTAPSGTPAPADALRALIDAQGPVGGPIDVWMQVGGSTMPFRARRIEVGVADDAGSPLFVATVRGVPKLPTTGAWSVVRRQVAGVPSGGGEAVPVSESRGVPLVRRYPVGYAAGDDTAYPSPPLVGATGPYRFADAADLLQPANPEHDYCLLQSAPTHGFLFPRPYAQAGGPARLRSDVRPELADVIARSTSKGAFPPPQNAIRLGSTYHFDVGPGGKLALSSPVSVVNHPTPLRLSGSTGHGAELLYDDATLYLALRADEWEAEFTGLRIWSDIAGMERVTGARMRIVGSTHQRPQVAELRTLLAQTIEDILAFIPVVGARGTQGPIDLGASNAKHEVYIEVALEKEVPESGFSVLGGKIKFKLGTSQSTGFDSSTGGFQAKGKLAAGVKGEFPVASVGAASIYIVVQLDIGFSIASVAGTVTAEKFDLLAFAGVGVKGSIGPFEAYAMLGIGFVLEYDFVASKPKYGGLVRLEAGIDLVVAKVKVRAEFIGLVYKSPPDTKCDYKGKVKVQVDIFLIISISATYTVTETVTL